MNNTNPTTATLIARFDVYGNTTLSPGATIDLNGTLYVQRGTNFFNNGTLTGTTATSEINFFQLRRRDMAAAARLPRFWRTFPLTILKD